MTHAVLKKSLKKETLRVLSTYYSENMGIEHEDVSASFGIVFSDCSTMHNVPEWLDTL